MQNEQTLAIGVTRVTVGLSAPVQIIAQKYCNWTEIGLITGGTLEIAGSTVGWGAGRPFASQAQNDHLNFGGSPMFWLYAAGATCVAHITWHFNRHTPTDSF
jgi:hypothetical protein